MRFTEGSITLTRGGPRKQLMRSGSAHLTAPAAHGTGSRAKIRLPRRLNAKRKRIWRDGTGTPAGLFRPRRTRKISRTRNIISLANERQFPHLVELAIPPEGFRSVLLKIYAFPREQRIPVHRDRSRQEDKQSYIRFCFPDAATADAFRTRFGGKED